MAEVPRFAGLLLPEMFKQHLRADIRAGDPLPKFLTLVDEPMLHGHGQYW